MAFERFANAQATTVPGAFVPRRCFNRHDPCSPAHMTACSTCPNDFPSLSLMQKRPVMLPAWWREAFGLPRIKVLAETPAEDAPIYRCQSETLKAYGGFKRVTVTGYGSKPEIAFHNWARNAETALKAYAHP